MKEKEFNNFWARIDIVKGKKTLKEICDNLGLSLATVRSTKCRNKLPNLSDAQKIAQYLGCTLDYLLTGHIPENDLSTTEKELIANYRTCPLQYRIAAESILRENANHTHTDTDTPSYYIQVDSVPIHSTATLTQK